MSFIQELKRRNVFRVAGAYAVTGWLIIEVAATLEDTLFLPGWLDTAITVSLLLGFPIVLFLAWAFELTPEGIVRDEDVPEDAPSRARAAGRLNLVIIVALTLALGYFVSDKFFFQDRRESAQESVAPALTSATAPIGTDPSSLSVAVLPFMNMSSDPEQEYFSDGLTEELLNLLVRIDGLKVPARTSSFFYKNKLEEIPLPEIARQLGVAHVLEGSVRKSGNQLRITAQLIEAESGFHLWSQTWDRTLDDIFAIQDEIAQAVADELHVTLLGETPRARVVDTRALELVLQGRFLFNHRGQENLERALALFEEAVQIDENAVDAWVGMTPLYLWLFEPQRVSDARAAIDKALALAPENPEAWVRQGNVLFAEGDAEAGVASVRRGLEFGPDNPLALAMNASMAFNRQDVDRGLALLEHAIATDPLHWANRIFLINTYMNNGRLAEAREALDESLALAPDDGLFYQTAAHLALLEGDFHEVLELAEKIRPPGPSSRGGDSRLSLSAKAQHSLGDRPASDAALEAFIASYGASHAFEVAEIYSWRGQMNEAFAWLERARDLGELRFQMDRIYLAQELESARNDPRWEAFVASLETLE